MTKTAFKWEKDARTGTYKCRIAGHAVYLDKSPNFSRMFQLTCGAMGLTSGMFSAAGVREAKSYAETLIRTRAAQQRKLWSDIVEALETQ